MARRHDFKEKEREEIREEKEKMTVLRGIQIKNF